MQPFDDMDGAMDYRVRKEDAVKLLAGMPDASVDLILTDPAYESLEKHRAVGTTTRLKKKWFDIFPNTRYEELFEQFYRVLKQDRHCYVMCDQETMFVIKPIGEQAGFTFFKPLVWDKQAIGMGYHYRARTEFILFFAKGKRRLRDNSISDILSFRRLWRPGYPTEKPVDLLQVPISQSTLAGEVVCDPFCGSGATGVAALSLGRKFIGGDTSDEAVEVTRSRLRSMV
jgi:site-specific DNA-methyltransferase (adenine-specific)